MPGRAGYSDRLSLLPQSALEAALRLLPLRQRQLLGRTEIDRVAHKVVAVELHLSMRQFYRERAAAVRTILASAPSLKSTQLDVLTSISVKYRMLFIAVADAIEANDSDRITAAIATLHAARNMMPENVAAIADVLVAVGDAANARMKGDGKRAVARLNDVARAIKDARFGGVVSPSALYGLMAMLNLVEEKLYRGDTDAAIMLAKDVGSIAAHLTDHQLEIAAQTSVANGYLSLPCYANEAYELAVSCVRRCSGSMTPRTIVRSLRVLASSLAELGWPANALALRDVIDPLAFALLGAQEVSEHRLWCASIELQCGSPSRASALARAARLGKPSIDRVATAATIVQSGALSALGLHEQSISLANNAEKVGKRQGWQRIVGEAKLVRAKSAFATSDHPEAKRQVAAAIPLLDRASPASIQCSAYALSYKLTRNPLHGMLADAYRL